MRCVIPITSWSQTVHNHSGTFLNCLSPSKKECRALHANTWHACNAKVGKKKHGTPTPTYIGFKIKLCSNNHIALDFVFGFCAYDINCYMKGSKKKWVFSWPNLPTVWMMKVGANLTRDEVCALEDVGFQLQQR